MAMVMARVYAAAALTLASAPISAQTTDAAARVRKNFDDCVYASAASQFKDPNQKDVSLVAERAFAACRTEEDAIGTYLLLLNVPASQAQALIIKIKLGLKATLRDIFLNPAKYLQAK